MQWTHLAHTVSYSCAEMVIPQVQDFWKLNLSPHYRIACVDDQGGECGDPQLSTMEDKNNLLAMFTYENSNDVIQPHLHANAEIRMLRTSLH